MVCAGATVREAARQGPRRGATPRTDDGTRVDVPRGMMSLTMMFGMIAAIAAALAALGPVELAVGSAITAAVAAVLTIATALAHPAASDGS